MLTLHKMNKVAAATFLAVMGGASSMACATRLTRMFPAAAPVTGSAITGLLHVTPSTRSAGKVDYGVWVYDATGTIVGLPAGGSAATEETIRALLTSPVETSNGSNIWFAVDEAVYQEDGLQQTLGELAAAVNNELTAEQLDGEEYSAFVAGVFRFRGVISEVAKSQRAGTTPGAPEKPAGRAHPQAGGPVARALFGDEE